MVSRPSGNEHTATYLRHVLLERLLDRLLMALLIHQVDEGLSTILVKIFL